MNCKKTTYLNSLRSKPSWTNYALILYSGNFNPYYLTFHQNSYCNNIFFQFFIYNWTNAKCSIFGTPLYIYANKKIIIIYKSKTIHTNAMKNQIEVQISFFHTTCAALTRFEDEDTPPLLSLHGSCALLPTAFGYPKYTC